MDFRRLSQSVKSSPTKAPKRTTVAASSLEKRHIGAYRYNSMKHFVVYEQGCPGGFIDDLSVL